MWFFSIMAWVFLGVTMFFSLALPFLDSHGVMGFSCLVEPNCQMDSNLSEVDLRNDRTHNLVTPEPDYGLW